MEREVRKANVGLGVSSASAISKLSGGDGVPIFVEREVREVNRGLERVELGVSCASASAKVEGGVGASAKCTVRSGGLAGTGVNCASATFASSVNGDSGTFVGGGDADVDILVGGCRSLGGKFNIEVCFPRWIGDVDNAEDQRVGLCFLSTAVSLVTPLTLPLYVNRQKT